MPITKLAKSTLKRKTTTMKRRALKEVRNPTTLTSSDYKRFCDVCHETRIRFRDGWTSVLSGRSYPHDYTKMHAGHWITRGALQIRYDERNCHCITCQENYWQSLGDRDTIDRYDRFMMKTYGKVTMDELRALAKEVKQITIPDWIDMAIKLYGKCQDECPIDLDIRFDSVYRRATERIKWQMIMQKITTNQGD